MLSFFRRFLGSWVVVALLGVLMVAFIVTGIGTPSGLGSLGGGPSADAVATVDGRQITVDEVARRAENELSQARQQQPGLTMPAFLAAIGGPAPLVENYLTGRLLEAWARRHGIAASPKLIDGEIASIPNFQGPGGQFDERQMAAILAQQRITVATLRDGVRDDLVRRQLLLPLSLGATVPPSLAQIYAGLFVARREGLAGLVPARPEAVPAPTEAEITAWYGTHLPAYSLPERRVIRYAVIDPATLPVAAPVPAEIAARYKQDAAKYAARSARALSQVVLPDEAAAKAFAAKVAGGTPFVTAATAAGFAAADISLGEVLKPDLARNASPAIADAAFAAKAGATLAPMKSSLGWNVVHVDRIADTAAKSLAEATPEISDALTKQKRAEAVGKIGQKIQDAVDGGASFDEVTKDNQLAVVTTPPVVAAGTAPGDPAFKPDATLTALLKPAFQGSTEDEPTLEQLGADGRFALLSLAQVVPGAPQPLAQVRDRVIADDRREKAFAQAKASAEAIVAKLRVGQSLAGALAAAKLAAPTPLAASQLELSRAPQVPPAMRTLFTLAPGKTALAPAPEGWVIVQLARIVPAPPQIVQGVAAGLRSELARQTGNEWLEQFARAAAADVKVKRNPAAMAALARQLAGQAPADEGQE